MNVRPFSHLFLPVSVAGAFGLALVLVGHLAAQIAAQPSLAVLSREGRRAMPLMAAGDQELVALDDLAAAFQLTVREEALGAITVSYKGKTIVLTPDQALASVAGRLVSLPAPPTRSGRRWLVPVEFLSRALAPIYDSKLDLRKPSRLLVVGDLRVPRVAVRYDPLGTTARLTIDASPRASSTVSQENDRIAIKFDADALDLSVAAIQPQGLVQAVRQVDPVTLLVDLGPRFSSFRAATQPLDTSTRLTIDLASTPPAEASAAPPPPPPSPAPPDAQGLGQPSSSLRTIAIDPGHGGEDEGAHGANGTKEKDLTLALARRLRAALEGRLGIRVVLTRDDDRNVPLDSRTAMANNNKADVFLSLHANAALRKAASGATMFYAAFDGQDEQAARASPSGERLPVFGGGSREVEIVRWDLAQSRHVERSAALADLLVQQFHDRVPLSAHPIDRGPLRILQSANMPAVLIEVGYLTNPDQEKQLAGAEFQTACVQAVFDALVKFRDTIDEGRRSMTIPFGTRAPEAAAVSGARQ